MKKMISMLLAVLMLAVSAAAWAQEVEDPYPYEGKDFYYQEIPQPRASYIPDGTPILGMLEYAGSSDFDGDAFGTANTASCLPYGCAPTTPATKVTWTRISGLLGRAWRDQGPVRRGY